MIPYIPRKGEIIAKMRVLSFEIFNAITMNDLLMSQYQYEFLAGCCMALLNHTMSCLCKNGNCE